MLLQGYLKIAMRQLIRHKGFSLLNVSGLAIGMACCILIAIFIRDELAYDRFHEKSDDIYRVSTRLIPVEQPPRDYAIASPVLGPALLEEVPEVTAATRLVAYYEASAPGRGAVRYQDRDFTDLFFWAEPSFFEVFSFPLTQGDEKTALAGTHSAIVTEETARRYFGNANPIGKIIEIDTGYSEESYTITGVMADIPENSHMDFDILISFSSLENVEDNRLSLESWFDIDSYVYVRLERGSSAEAVNDKLRQMVENHMGERWTKHYVYFLFPLTDIHLRSHMLVEIEANGDVTHVYILSVVAFLILLTACINFMNLSTARSQERAREVGIRKAAGARRWQLIGQFYLESFLVSTLAMILAVILAKIALPRFAAFIGRPMALGLDSAGWLLAIMLLGALLAGSYPAFFLSSFRPVEVLGGTFTASSKKARFRKLTAVVQFSLSLMLIIGTFVIFDQLKFMRNTEMGFERERVLVFHVRDSSLRDRYQAVKERIERLPNVRGSAASALVMGDEAPMIVSRAVGTDKARMLSSIVIDEDWAAVYDLDFVAGRNFAEESGNEANYHSFLLNESAARVLGWEDPADALGERMIWGGDLREGEVIGVVQDFHYRPLRYPIQPAIMMLRPIAYHFLAVKLGPGDISRTLEELESVWDEIFPQRPFDYFFLDDGLEQMYRADERLGQAIGFFSAVAVFLACLGLLALASFSAERRTREIGIRKAFGAGVKSIAMLLAREFGQLLLISTVIAWPLIYFIMYRWLERFAYRTAIHPGHFLAGGLLAVLIAALTVIFHVMKAARTRAAEALRYE